MNAEVCVCEAHWGRVYTGTKESLVATGLFQSDWFPRPDEKRRTKRIRIEDREVRIRVRTKRLFDVYWDYTPQEQEQQEALKALRSRASEFQRALACLPGSAQQFRHKMARDVEVDTKVFLDHQNSNFCGGYSFDPDCLREIQDAFGFLLDTINEARVCYSPSLRRQCVASLKREYFGEADDPGVVSFLAKLKSSAAQRD